MLKILPTKGPYNVMGMPLLINYEGTYDWESSSIDWNVTTNSKKPFPLAKCPLTPVQQFSARSVIFPYGVWVYVIVAVWIIVGIIIYVQYLRTLFSTWVSGNYWATVGVSMGYIYLLMIVALWIIPLINTVFIKNPFAPSQVSLASHKQVELSDSHKEFINVVGGVSAIICAVLASKKTKDQVKQPKTNEADLQ